MSERDTTNRREILKRAGAAFVAPYFIPASVLAGPGRVAPSDRIEISVVGVGVRGKDLISNLPDEVRVTALCDCSTDQIESARRPKGDDVERLESFINDGGANCAGFQDYREMFSNHRCDAAIIATSDHHHALASILAIESGCDVYVEKPLAVTIGEGRAIVDAAERHDAIVQVGSQQRTMKVNRRACQFIRDGGLGEISLVEERNFPGPMPYIASEFPVEAVPSSLNWDAFCGPTPLRQYNRKIWVKDAFKFGYLTWRGWDLFDDYSGHLMTNWGAHSIDMIQFALGMDESGPVQVTPNPSAVDAFTDDQWHAKTPPLGTLADKHDDRQRFAPLVMKYANGTEIQFNPNVTRTVFHGERGKLYLSRNSYQTEPAGLLPPPSQEEQSVWNGKGIVAKPHLENWINAIRKRSELNAPVEIGHRSASVCHLANIARKMNRPLRWDAAAERFVDDPEADQMLRRPRRAGYELPS